MPFLCQKKKRKKEITHLICYGSLTEAKAALRAYN
jgi:hypothetical protein